MQQTDQLPEIFYEVVLTYSAVIDRSRRTIGTRLMAISTSGNPLPVSKVVKALAELLPTKTNFSMVAPFGLEYDAGLLGLVSPRNMLIEVPAVALMSPIIKTMTPDLASRGMRLVLRGRADTPLDQNLLPLFEYAVIAASEDRRKGPPPPGVARKIDFIVSGAETVSSIDDAFLRGAAATIGWPLQEPIIQNGKSLQPSQAAVIKLLALVNQYAEIEEIERAMKIDPGIAFKLLKFINSPVFGGTQQITSFSHAIMMLGYKKMLRWLALLMSSSSKDVNNLPVMNASVRRGLFMERLAPNSSDKRDSLFIAGAFSLLDKITSQPLEDLFKVISVNDDIRDAVIYRTGPLADALLLIEAIEKGIPSKIFSMQKKMNLSAYDCNTALLSALRAAEEFEF